MLLFYGIIFSKLKCFIDILAKTFLQTCGSILLKRNITFSDFFKSTNLSIDRQNMAALRKSRQLCYYKVKIGRILRSLYNFLCGNDTFVSPPTH